MNPERVRLRGLTFVAVRPARLAGYALRFNKVSRAHAGTGHANIEQQPSATVEGVLYELADCRQILLMDPYERVPVNYSRVLMEVTTGADECVSAWTYVANRTARRDGLLPEAAYMAHLLCGEPWLTPAYHARLRAWPVADQPQG